MLERRNGLPPGFVFFAVMEFHRAVPIIGELEGEQTTPANHRCEYSHYDKSDLEG